MPNITIDNQSITVEDGATILQAARRAGIDIPSLCFLSEGTPCTSCFVCVVKVAGSPRLAPACATRVTEGMVVESESAEVHAARRTALELLLSDHLGDCLAPCQLACPAHVNTPAVLRHLAAGRPRAAQLEAKCALVLPATLGYVCRELCEKACRRGQVDSPVAICRLHRAVAEAELAADAPYHPALPAPSGKRVAIIGAGPAGLAAAYALAQSGHACTLFDNHPLPGGALRYAVPDDRLPRAVLDAEIQGILQRGIAWRPGVCVGTDIALADIRREFSAVLVAAGADPQGEITTAWNADESIPRDARVRQTNLPGVFHAGATVSPTPHAVRAIADGRLAARAIDQYLAGTPLTRGASDLYSVHLGRLSADELAEYAALAANTPRLAPTETPAPADIAAEAGRCLHCDCRKLPTCKLREYGLAYGAEIAHYRGERRPFTWDTSHPAVIYEPGKCIACGKCLQLAEQAHEPRGLAFLDRGFLMRMAVPFNGTLAEGLQCAAAACVNACPTGALAWKDDAGK